MVMDLELVPTHDLVVELQSRFEHSVFSAVSAKHTDHQAPGAAAVETYRYVGHPRMCQGLAAGLVSIVQRDLDWQVRPAPVEDLL